MKKQTIKKKAIKYLKENYSASFSEDIGNNGIGDDIIDAYIAGYEKCKDELNKKEQPIK